MDIVLMHFNGENIQESSMKPQIIHGHKIDLWDILWWKKDIAQHCWGRTIVDSFEERVLVDEIPEKIKEKMEIPGFKFRAPLELPYDTEHFMHGANMLPGMIEGINNFLSIRKGTSLMGIKQVVFKELIRSDVVYSILSSQDVALQKKSNMYMIFLDNKGNEYFLYAQDIAKAWLDRERNPICLQNKFATELLLEEQTENQKIELSRIIQSMGSHIEYGLVEPNISLDEKEHYKQKMTKNTGFMMETIWDMVEDLCGASLGKWGLAARYEDIQWAKNIDLECFFDGTLQLVVDQTTPPRMVWDHGRYQYKFSLLHKGKETIVSWIATFWVTESD